MVSMGIFWVSSWHGRWPRQQHPLPHPEDRFTDPAPDPHPLGKAKAEIVRPYWVWKPGFRRRDRFVGMFLWIFSPRKMWKWDYRVLKTLAAFWGISPWNIWRILEIWRKHVDNMGIFDGIQFKSFGVSGAVFLFQCDYQGMADFSANFLLWNWWSSCQQRNHAGYRRPYNWDLKLARMAVLRGHNSCESIGGMQTYCNPWVPGIYVFLADHLGHFRDECCRITGRCCDHLQVPWPLIPTSHPVEALSYPFLSQLLLLLIAIRWSTSNYPAPLDSTRLFPSFFEKSKAMKAAKEDPSNPKCCDLTPSVILTDLTALAPPAACRFRPSRATAGMCVVPKPFRNTSIPNENCTDTLRELNIAMGHHKLTNG